MVTVAMRVSELTQDGPGKMQVVIQGSTTTERNFGVQTQYNATDTIAALNTNLRAAAKDFLEENYPEDANWALAQYVLFGGGQIVL